MRKHFVFFIAFSLYAPLVWGMEASSESKEGEQPHLNENEIWKEKIEYMEGVKFEDLSEEIIEEAKALILAGKKPKVLAVNHFHIFRMVKTGRLPLDHPVTQISLRTSAWKVLFQDGLQEEVDVLRSYLIPKDDYLIKYIGEAKTLGLMCCCLKVATNALKLFPYLKKMERICFDEATVDPYLLEYCFKNLPSRVKKMSFNGTCFIAPAECKKIREKYMTQLSSTEISCFVPWGQYRLEK